MRARVRAARVVLGLFYTCNVAPYGVYVDPELNRGCAPGVFCAPAICASPKPSCSAPASRQVLPSTEEKDLTSGLM